MRCGEYRFVAQPYFEEMVRRRWENEYGHGQQPQGEADDAEAVWSKNAEVAKIVLKNHGFVQPFQLQQDRRQQDQWTTYVEYLAFECFCHARLARFVEKLRPQHDVEWEKLVKAEVVKPSDTYDDPASAEVENLRRRELEVASRGMRLFMAATDASTTDTSETDTSETDTAQKAHAQSARQSRKRKSQQSTPSHHDDIARRNKFIDEYLHNTQKYRKVKAEADQLQRRVDWIRSEITKIETEHKAVGRCDSSAGTTGKKRKPTDEAIMEPGAKKPRRMGETEQMAAGRSENSRTTRSKKRKLPTDEDTLEAQREVAGNSDGPGTGRRKRQKGIHERDGGATQGHVPEPRLEAAVSAQVSSAAITNSGPRRQPKRTSSRTAVLGSREDRLKTLRPRIDNKVVGLGKLKTQDGKTTALGEASRRKARGRPRSTHGKTKIT